MAGCAPSRTRPATTRSCAGFSTRSSPARSARSACGSRWTSRTADAGERAARLARPVIVLSRHAGPGDSFLLVHQLLSVYGRRPRIVMKATMQLDPGVDVVTNRLPNVFIQPRQVGEKLFTEQIERLASGLDQAGALVIFPEGGNWTPGRWQRGIRRLERAGRGRPGGEGAADAQPAPAAAGRRARRDRRLPRGRRDLRGPCRPGPAGQRRRRLAEPPHGAIVRAKWWRVPVDEVPRSADHEAQVQWLYEWWQRIDTWISENRPNEPEGLQTGSGSGADSPSASPGSRG